MKYHRPGFKAAALALLLPLACAAQSDRCAGSAAEAGVLLGRLQLPREWRETTMRDGKPLILRFDESEPGLLRMEFVKSGEGRWAEGIVRVCRRSGKVLAQVASGELAVSETVSWLLREVLRRDASFTLTPVDRRRLRVSTVGWSGDFEPAENP